MHMRILVRQESWHVSVQVGAYTLICIWIMCTQFKLVDCKL